MRRITAITGLGLAAVLALSGCSAAADSPAPTDDMTSSAAVDTVNSDGSTLRATLTALLADHVYLAGAAIDQALSDLGGYAVSFGQLINSVVPELPAEAVQAELEMHATSLVAAIDANIAGDSAYFALLKEAVGHMPMTAQALAGGIAANKGIQ